MKGRATSVVFRAGAMIPGALAGRATAGEIHQAAEDNDLPTVKRLLEQTPALIRARDNMQRTPLHKAARFASKEMPVLRGRVCATFQERGNGIGPSVPCRVVQCRTKALVLGIHRNTALDKELDGADRESMSSFCPASCSTAIPAPTTDSQKIPGYSCPSRGAKER